MSKDTVERPGHVGKIQRVDEQARVPDLPAGATSHVSPQLLLPWPTLPSRLFLKGAERVEVALSVDHPFHGGGAERADQLVLQVCDANVKAELFHLGASEIGAEFGSLEPAPEVALLAGVTEACESYVQALGAKPTQEVPDCLRAANRHNRDALNVEIAASAFGQRFNRDLVAGPFDEHDRSCVLGEHQLRQRDDDLRVSSVRLPLPRLRNSVERVRLDVEDDLTRGCVADEP